MYRLKACLLVVVCFLASSAWAQSTQVLVSIHPVALLIKSAWPQLQVDTLMQANQSPHDFALKPSHRGVIAQAQYVVWLGKDMEPYLVSALRGKTEALDLSILFDEKESGLHQGEDHHGNHDEHNHGDQDPHIWLNPEAVPRILAMVQKQLDLSAPQAFLEQFALWQVKAKQDLMNNPNSFVSFHDAFHYWVKYFQLQQAAVLAIHPEQPIGTRHLLEVRAKLENDKVACMFVEPQFKASIVGKLQQGTDVPVVRIDPLGADFNVENGQFLAFYEYLQQQFLTCLNPK